MQWNCFAAARPYHPSHSFSATHIKAARRPTCTDDYAVEGFTLLTDGHGCWPFLWTRRSGYCRESTCGGLKLPDSVRGRDGPRPARRRVFQKVPGKGAVQRRRSPIPARASSRPGPASSRAPQLTGAPEPHAISWTPGGVGELESPARRRSVDQRTEREKSAQQTHKLALLFSRLLHGRDLLGRVLKASKPNAGAQRGQPHPPFPRD